MLRCGFAAIELFDVAEQNSYQRNREENRRKTQYFLSPDRLTLFTGGVARARSPKKRNKIKKQPQFYGGLH